MEGQGKDSILVPILEKQVNKQRQVQKRRNHSILSMYMCVFLSIWRLKRDDYMEIKNTVLTNRHLPVVGLILSAINYLGQFTQTSQHFPELKGQLSQNNLVKLPERSHTTTQFYLHQKADQTKRQIGNLAPLSAVSTNSRQTDRHSYPTVTPIFLLSLQHSSE